MIGSDPSTGSIPRVRLKGSEVASETAFALLDSLWHGPVGLAFIDRDLAFVQVNEFFARLDGLSTEAHAGVPLPDIVTFAAEPQRDELRRMERAVRGVLESGRPYLNLPVSGASPEGSPREWLCSYYPVLAPDGSTRGVLAVVVDATDDRERQAAIERAHAVAQRTAGRLALLQDVTAAFSAAHGVADVAAVVTERVREALGASVVSLRVVAGDALEAVALAGVPPGAAPPRIRLDDDAPIARAATRNEPVWIESVAAFHHAFPAWSLEDFARQGESFAAVPLAARGVVLGVLALVFRSGHALDPEDRAFILAVSRQCAQALERAVLLEAERAQHSAAQAARDRLSRLLDITAALSQARTPEDVLSVLVFQANRAFGVLSAVAYLRKGDELELGAAMGGATESRPRMARLPMDLPIPVAAATRHGVPLWFESQEALLAAFPGLPELVPYSAAFGAVAALPLRVGGEIVGGVEFAFDAPRAFRPEDRELLGAAAEQCALALDRARLLDSEQRTRALLDAVVDNAPIGIALVDRDLRYARVNRILAEMNGLPVEAHLGRTAREILPGLPWEEIARSWLDVLRTGEPILDVELTGETPAAPGKRRTWLESWYPVRSGGDIQGIGSLVREVTAEREAAEFQRNVLGIVGHDLRNPLSALVTSARLLLGDENLTPERARLGARILSNANRMERIISVLLDYARVRAGQAIPLRRQPCDVAALVDVVAEECEASHPGRAVVRGGQGDPVGEWDPDRLSQALANLVANALDYSPTSSCVEVSWRGERGEVEIEVANEGRPIPPDSLARLFEPFRRAGEPGKGDSDGLGLGLFIARAIVLAHGGHIEVQSRDGERTRFTVRLPRAIS